MFEGQPQSEVDALIKSDPEFRQLYHRHRELDKQVLAPTLGIVHDPTVEQLRGISESPLRAAYGDVLASEGLAKIAG